MLVSAQFSRGSYGASTCEAGTTQVPKDRCEEASVALGLYWIGEMQSSNTIPGCQVDSMSTQVYFNNLESTQVNNIFAPLCVIVTTTSTVSSSSTTSSSTISSITSSSTPLRTTITTTASTTYTASSTTITQTVGGLPRDIPRDPDGWWRLSSDGNLERHHVTARRSLFAPSDVNDCPVPVAWLLPTRTTSVTFLYTGTRNSMNITDVWHEPTMMHLPLPYLWIGTTFFTVDSGESNSSVDVNIGEVGAAAGAKVALWMIAWFAASLG